MPRPPLALPLLLGLLSGCASYDALPLATEPTLAGGVAALAHDGIDVDRPLTVASVAALALGNNPDLLAAASQRDVARGQTLQAGLLPNPQVSGNVTPVVAGAGTTIGYSAGLSFDLKALITRASRQAGAEAAAAQVDATLLWQAWQLVGKARLLAVQIIDGARMRTLLADQRDLLAGRAARTGRALAAGDATIAATAPDVVALNDARRQLDDLDRLTAARRHDLDALLGLSPDATLALADAADLPAPPPDPERALARRPDLLALRHGYRSQDQKLRGAILAQFPNLTFGLTGGSDTSNIRTIGPQMTLDLPVFDRNQGGVAVERATREQLHAEYAARLSAAAGEVRALLAETALLQAQLSALRARIPAAELVAAQAQAAYAAGNLDERGYVDLVMTRLAKRQEAATLAQTLDEQRVALDTLTGADMPPIDIGDPP